jgi:hypothetical protein
VCENRVLRKKSGAKRQGMTGIAVDCMKGRLKFCESHRLSRECVNYWECEKGQVTLWGRGTCMQGLLRERDHR